MQLCARCGPLHLKKVTPLSQQTPLKIEVLLSPPSFFENWVKGSTLQSPPSSRKGGGRGCGEVHIMQENRSLDFSIYVILAIFYLGPTWGCLSPTQISLGNLIPYKQSFFLLRLLFPKAKKNRTEERERKFFLAGT